MSFRLWNRKTEFTPNGFIIRSISKDPARLFRWIGHAVRRLWCLPTSSQDSCDLVTHGIRISVDLSHGCLLSRGHTACRTVITNISVIEPAFSRERSGKIMILIYATLSAISINSSRVFYFTYIIRVFSLLSFWKNTHD